MKIESHVLPVKKLTEFAKEYNLIMEVRERRDWSDPQSKFYARFKHIEERTLRGMLQGTHGNGADEYEAICDYCKQISGKRLAYKAYHEERVNIDAPHLSFNIDDYRSSTTKPNKEQK